MPTEIEIKLSGFEQALWESYWQVRGQDHTLWCSLHKVMDRVGMSLPLFTERLNQLWQDQFTQTITKHKYQFGLEVDCSPTERYRRRKQLIIIDNYPMFIIQMNEVQVNG